MRRQADEKGVQIREKAETDAAEILRQAGLENERARQVRARLEQSRGEIRSLSAQIDALLARAEDGIPDPGPEASGTAPADPDPAELVDGDA